VYFYLYNIFKDRWLAHLRSALPPPAVAVGGATPPSPALSQGKLGPVAHLSCGFAAGLFVLQCNCQRCTLA
jgi:hypothetical protein